MKRVIFCLVLLSLFGIACQPIPELAHPTISKTTEVPINSTNNSIITKSTPILPEAKVDNVKIKFMTIAKDAGAVFKEDERELYVKTSLMNGGEMVAFDKSEWKVLWAQVFPRQINAPLLNETMMGIGVFAGEKPSEGYNITIMNIVENKDSIQVFIDEVYPDMDCKVVYAPTRPYHIIQTAKSEKPIDFVYERKVLKCE